MTTTHNTDGTAPEAIVRAFYEPFRTGDTNTYDEVLAEDWIDLPLAPGQQQGPAGMAGQIALFRAAMPDYTVEHQDIIVQGDKVAARNTVSGPPGRLHGTPAHRQAHRDAHHGRPSGPRREDRRSGR